MQKNVLFLNFKIPQRGFFFQKKEDNLNFDLKSNQRTL